MDVTILTTIKAAINNKAFISELLFSGGLYRFTIRHYGTRFDMAPPSVLPILDQLCAMYRITEPFFVRTHEGMAGCSRTSSLPGLFYYRPVAEAAALHVNITVSIPGADVTTVRMNADRWAAELDGTSDFIGEHVHHTTYPFLPKVYVSPIPSVRTLRAQNSHKPAYSPMPSRPSGSHQGVYDDCEDFMSQLV